MLFPYDDIVSLFQHAKHSISIKNFALAAHYFSMTKIKIEIIYQCKILLQVLH